MRKLLILLALSTVACAQDRHITIYRDPQVMAYVDELSKDLPPMNLNSVSFQIAPLNIAQYGICRSYSNGDREVIINEQQWPTMTDSRKAQVILHEIGHCVFSLPHASLVYINNCPTSIMVKSAFDDVCFVDNYRQYVDEVGGTREHAL